MPGIVCLQRIPQCKVGKGQRVSLVEGIDQVNPRSLFASISIQ